MRFLEGLSGTNNLNTIKSVILRFMLENKQQDLAYDDLDMENENNAKLFHIPKKDTDLSKPNYEKVVFPPLKPSFFGFIPSYKEKTKSGLSGTRLYIRLGGPERKSFYWDEDDDTKIYCDTPERDFLYGLEDLIDFNPEVKTGLVGNVLGFIYDKYPMNITFDPLGKAILDGSYQKDKNDKLIPLYFDLASDFLDMFSNWLSNSLNKDPQNADLKNVAKILIASFTSKEDSVDLAKSLASVFVSTLKEDLMADRAKALYRFEIEIIFRKNIIDLLDPVLSSIYNAYNVQDTFFSNVEVIMKAAFLAVLDTRFDAISRALDPALGVQSIKDSEQKVETAKEGIDQFKQQEEAVKLEIERVKDEIEDIQEALYGAQSTLSSKTSGAKTQSFLSGQSRGLAIGLGIASLGLAGSTYHYYQKSKKL